MKKSILNKSFTNVLLDCFRVIVTWIFIGICVSFIFKVNLIEVFSFDELYSRFYLFVGVLGLIVWGFLNNEGE